MALFLGKLSEENPSYLPLFLFDENLLADIRLLLINELIWNKFNIKFISMDYINEFFHRIEVRKFYKNLNNYFFLFTDFIDTTKCKYQIKLLKFNERENSRTISINNCVVHFSVEPIARSGSGPQQMFRPGSGKNLTARVRVQKIFIIRVRIQKIMDPTGSASHSRLDVHQTRSQVQVSNVNDLDWVHGLISEVINFHSMGAKSQSISSNLINPICSIDLNSSFV
jgi:hypothetical protein